MVFSHFDVLTVLIEKTRAWMIFMNSTFWKLSKKKKTHRAKLQDEVIQFNSEFQNFVNLIDLKTSTLTLNVCSFRMSCRFSYSCLLNLILDYICKIFCTNQPNWPHQINLSWAQLVSSKFSTNLQIFDSFIRFAAPNKKSQILQSFYFKEH